MESQVVILIVQALLRYGPTVAASIRDILTKQTVTVEDIDKLFEQVRPYDSYGIPDIAPTKPNATPPPNATPVVP